MEDDEPRQRAPANFVAGGDGSVTDVIRRAGGVAWAFVGLAAVVAILYYLGSKVAIVFPPLVLAGMIVFILNPFVTALQRRGVPRSAGVGLAYLIFFGVITLIVLLAIPTIRDQGQELADHWPEARADIEQWVDDRADDLEGTPFAFDREELVDDLTSSEDGGGIDVQASLERITEIGFQVLEVILIFVLAPIFAFYLLIDLPHIRRSLEGLIPEGARDDVVLVARRINDALGGFFRGQLVVALIVGFLSSLGLWLIGLPFWLIIGMIAGFFNLIPLIGPYVGGVPAVLVGLTADEPITALWAVVALFVVQQIDNHFISPLVMKRAVKLHPVVVMTVLLFGGSAFGFFGLLVAVPTTAVLKIVFGHLWRVRVLGQTPQEWYEESEASDEVPAVGIVEKVPVEDGGGRFRNLFRRDR